MTQRAAQILIAEDSIGLYRVMERLLQQRGHTVRWARDGFECLQMLTEGKPDLLVLDILMPEKHGIEVLREIRGNPALQDVRVVVCSSKDYRPDRRVALELGAKDFILKPLAPELFVERIEKQLTATPCEPDRSLAEPLQGKRGGEAWVPRLDPDAVTIRFWGTRGSIPVSGPEYVRHGGNTSCVEIRYADEVIILDAGTGIRPLGMKLLSEGPRRVHLFVTHAHWDHIQGFPFFVPAYVPGYETIVHAASGFNKSVQQLFQGQHDKDYFPIQFEDMRGAIVFQELMEKPVEIGPITVRWAYTQHPGVCAAFRIDIGNWSMAYVSDNEFAQGYVSHPSGLSKEFAEVAISRGLLRLLEGVDVLVHEAQYTNEEYIHKIGWGHTSLGNACQLVAMAQPRQWIITHHDPVHTDDILDGKLLLTRQVLAELGCNVPVTHTFDHRVDQIVVGSRAAVAAARK